MIHALQGHTIICGCGRNGLEALEQLIKQHQDVVVIEKIPVFWNNFPKKFYVSVAMPKTKASLWGPIFKKRPTCW